jgi:hypothetical protein
MQKLIDSAFLLNQVRHWLATSINGYLGSGYGIDLKAYLHKPMNTFDGDAIIDKMRVDIPALAALPRNVINLYFENAGLDGKKLHITIGEGVFSVLL